MIFFLSLCRINQSRHGKRFDFVSFTSDVDRFHSLPVFDHLVSVLLETARMVAALDSRMDPSARLHRPSERQRHSTSEFALRHERRLSRIQQTDENSRTDHQRTHSRCADRSSDRQLDLLLSTNESSASDHLRLSR